MNGARILAVCGIAGGVAVSALTDTKPVRELVSQLTRKHGIRDRRSTRLAPGPDPEQLALAL